MSTRRSASGRRHGRFLVGAGLLVLAALVPAGLLAQPDLDEQVRAIAAELRCPVCQNLSVADSSSELAQDMRAIIRDQLAAGKSPDEIRAYFVSKYGDWILLAPRPRGLALLLWLGPFAGAAVGVAAAVMVARRWARAARRAPGPPPDPALLGRVRQEALAEPDVADGRPLEAVSPLERERHRLYEALAELDFDHRAGKLSTADFEATRAEYEARAARVLQQLVEAETAAPAPPPRPAAAPAPGAVAARPSRPRHVWRLVAAGGFLLIFGVGVGYSLTQAVRPRESDEASITGDPLTGTGRTAAAPVPRELPGVLAAGRAAYEREEFGPAIEAFRQALALDPANPEAHTFMGLVLLRGAHGEEALRAIDRALGAHPGYPLALWAKGVALAQARQDYAGAIEAWEGLLKVNLSPEESAHVARLITDARARLAARGAGADRPADNGADAVRRDRPAAGEE